MKPVPILMLALIVSLSACSTKPPTPDWQMNAKNSLERFEAAYLSGNAAVEMAEFKRARDQIASTGQVDLILRAELIRCATRVASLVFEECAGFEKLRQDAALAERAYADYLAGRSAGRDAALLPAQHRAVASAGSDTGAAAAVQQIIDPLPQLVAAGVLLRTGRATPALISQAVDTASAQGWRRPLLAWLGVQAMRATEAGATQEAQRIRRRIDLVTDAYEDTNKK